MTAGVCRECGCTEERACAVGFGGTEGCAWVQPDLCSAPPCLIAAGVHPLYCACGWRRPLIAIAQRDGALPPDNLLPFYRCPCCGVPYVAGELTPDEARGLWASLDQEMTASFSERFFGKKP